MTQSEQSLERLREIQRKARNPDCEGISSDDCEFIQREFHKLAKGLSSIPDILSQIGDMKTAIKYEVENGQRGFKEVGEAIAHVNQKVHTHERRIGDLDSRVRHIESLSTHTKLAVDANTAIQQQHFEHTKTLSSQIDGIRDIVKLISESRPAASQKPATASFMSKIPWQGWLAGALVIIAIASMATGQFDTFMNAIQKPGQKSEAVKSGN